MTSPADPFADGLPTVEGAALRLRPLAPRDRERVFALYADKEAVRFGFQPKMDTLDDADELIFFGRDVEIARLWGRGLGAGAVALLAGFAFDVLGLRRLEADVDPRNTASLRLLERLGFVREGHLRERWILGGEIQDAVFYGLLRREWAARR